MPPRKRHTDDAEQAPAVTDQPTAPDGETPDGETPTGDVPAELVDNDPAHMTDEELGDATGQAAVDAGTETRLQTVWPHDGFVLDDGTEVTAAGSLVPADRVNDIVAAAEAAGVTIREVN